MKRIILASASPQRKKLLKLLGVKFTVRPSRIPEKTKIKTTCSALVKENALLKAKDVSRGVKKGIVIGADTLVYLGNKKIVGKPRHLADAKKMLKGLSRRPQWVYTGLAVIDQEAKKVITGFEKTKIFMNKLSKRQIDNYYKHVSPLHKAGGFDIENRGGLFIRRIEGCYFNVIGLPIAKLSSMLKKVGVRTLLVLLAATIAGCATEYNLATQEQETLLYGTEKEIKIGESISKQFEKEFKINTDVDLNERVAQIAGRIAAVCDRQELVYTVRIIDEDKLNAVSLPGGFIYVYRGMIDKSENDDQLACVIAHEFGHITAKHAIKKLQGLYGYTLLKVLAIQSQSADLARGVDLAFASAFTAYSQEDEFMADRLGIKYAQKAGYNPEGMAGSLKVLQKAAAKEPTNEFSYWRTHPYLTQRISAANKAVTGTLEFKDYLNLTGEQ